MKRWKITALIMFALLEVSTQSAFAVNQSTAPVATDIVVTNNGIIPDSVVLSNFDLDLATGGNVNLYATNTSTTVLASAIVAAGQTSVTISVPQLGVAAGTVYATVKELNMTESTRTPVGYVAEIASTILDTTNNILVTNNTGSADTIIVSALDPGNIINLYASKTSTQVLVTATATGIKGSATATLSVPQLGQVAGNVFATVIRVGFDESPRLSVTYSAEGRADAPLGGKIGVINNAGIPDIIAFSGLTELDVIKLYATSTSTMVLATGTVPDLQSTLEISVSQLGSTGGTIYATITNATSLESARTPITYAAEVVTKPLVVTSKNIVVTNNTGSDDTVDVNSLKPGDMINLYATATSTVVIGTATVSAGQAAVTIDVPKLGQTAGTIYATVTSIGLLESPRFSLILPPEVVASAPPSGIVINNAGIPDTITFINLLAGDKVNLYSTNISSNILATGTVAQDQSTLIISVPQLGSAAGSVYATMTKATANESLRTQISYVSEATSSALTILSNIMTVTNNTGSADTVDVVGLNSGDIIKIYATNLSTTVLGTGTVATGQTTVTVKVPQLGQSTGTLYASIISVGLLESPRLGVDYIVEPTSVALNKTNVNITNNVGVSDTVEFVTLSPGDTIRLYADSTTTKVLGIGTASQTTLEISVPQLGSAAGSVYATITKATALESGRTKLDYLAEVPSITLDAINNPITVINNTGSADTVDVTGLKPGDIIKIYATSVSTVVLGTGKVAIGQVAVTVNVPQLGQIAGTLYATATSVGLLESPRLGIAYGAEGNAIAPDSSKVTVTNNAGKADTVVFTGLVVGDIVKLYVDGITTKILRTGTVLVGQTSITISVPQLGSISGSIYGTTTEKTALESTRTKIDYLAEAASTVLSVGNTIIVTNNTGSSDTVTVSALNQGDIIKIYATSASTVVLGIGKVATGQVAVTVNVPQLGQIAGTLYATVTSVGLLESPKLGIVYGAEGNATAPDSSKVTVTNNAGKADIVVFTGLAIGDIVKLYVDGTTTKVLGTGTVAALQTTVTISVPQLGSTLGSVYATITKKTALESTRTKIDYLAEAASTVLSVTNTIIVTNNTGSSDTVAVSALNPGDIIKIYATSASTVALSTGKVATGQVSVTVNVPQLGQISGTLYATVTSVGLLESPRLGIVYGAEGNATAPDLSKITVTNNAGKADVVVFTGLAVGDIVKLYIDGITTKVIGTGTVAALQTTVTISVPQLGSISGSVYGTITKKTALESTRIKIDYLAEAKSTYPVATNVTVTNNKGKADTLAYTNLLVGDIVKVYTTATSTAILGTAKVSTGQTTATVSVAQLGAKGGNVYTTVTNVGKLESDRTTLTVAVEQ